MHFEMLERVNEEGTTAFWSNARHLIPDAIAKTGSKDMFEMMLVYCPKGLKDEKIIECAGLSGSIEIVELAESLGYVIDRNNVNEALSGAAASGSVELFKYIVNKVESQKHKGVTAWKFDKMRLNDYLAKSAPQGKFQKEMVDYLVSLGADLISKGFLRSLLISGVSTSIEYAINAIPEESGPTFIGISNREGEFSSHILGLSNEQMESDHVFIMILTEEVVKNPSIMSRMNGFVNPGNGDTYPDKKVFSLKDMDVEKMDPMEHLYQAIVGYAIANDVPYVGFCAGSQHLALNRDGSLQRVLGHSDREVPVKFVQGTIPYFMALDSQEKQAAIRDCTLPEVSIEEAAVMHNFAAVEGMLGEGVVLSALSEQGVVESLHFGASQVGFQFHPEYRYHSGDPKTNRNRFIIDSFFEMCKNHASARGFARAQCYSDEVARELTSRANNAVMSRLQECASSQNPSPSNALHLWGTSMGSHQVIAKPFCSEDVIVILPGVALEHLTFSQEGDDLVLTHKETKDQLVILEHFMEGGLFEMEAIHFSDGKVLNIRKDSFNMDEANKLSSVDA